MSKHKYNRRDFLGTMPCLALGSTTLYSSLINMKAMNALLSSSNAVGDDYKAIVCILLSGGNDSFNMVIPRGNAEYNEYLSVRGNNAIAQENLLAINPITNDGREFGLHPNLSGIQSLFENGKLGIINNVGNLVEPVSKSAYEAKTAKLPLGLLSHSDQVMHWQTAFPQDRSSTGWGGKMADILKSQNLDNGVSMNISLGGNNVFQRGNEVVEYAINNTGGISILGWNNPDPFLTLMTEDITDKLNKDYEDIFRDSYNGVLKRSIDSNETFNAAIAAASPLNTVFSQANLSKDLAMVAKSISIRETLGAKRQIYFVSMGGFDNHDDLINNHGELMTVLGNAMSEFYTATEEMGISDCVTTFTISDFARTLTSNGNGTDHAWGGNALVMGGAVKGRDMYGDFPVLALESNLEVGGGILIPTTSADTYFAEIALWFGISPNDLSLILPNIGTFYDVNSGTAPLGFLL